MIFNFAFYFGYFHPKKLPYYQKKNRRKKNFLNSHGCRTLVKGICGINCEYLYDKVKEEIVVYGNGKITVIDGLVFEQYTKLEIIEYKGNDNVNCLNEINNIHLFGIKVGNNYQDDGFCEKVVSKNYGKLSDNVNWLIKDKEIIVYGEGEIPNFVERSNEVAWLQYVDDITEFVIEEGITRIVINAFNGLMNVEKFDNR